MLALALVAIALQVQDPARALQDLQRAIQASPNVEKNYTDLGNLLLATQNFSEAIVVLERTRERFPQSAQAALSLGVAYYGMRRFPDAVGAFIEASKLAPDVAQPIAFLARILEHAGAREAEVVERFREYTKAVPSSALGHFALGKATASETELRRAMTLAPSNPDVRFELASLFERGGKLAEAAVEFERAATLAPANPEPHFRLFRIYTRLSKPDKAELHRARHEKLTAAEKAAAERRQAATKHLDLKVRQ